MGDATMVLRTAGSVFVVFLWSVAGVLRQNTMRSVCALKGSSVDLRCPVTYPSWTRFTEKIWFNKCLNHEPYDLRLDPKYEGRVEYHGTTEKDCILRITDLRESDKATYHFRYKTDNSGWKDGSHGFTLSLTDLKLQVEETWIYYRTLTCSTTCPLTGNPTYIWYKNGQHLDESTYKVKYSVSSENAGSYSCAVKGHEDLRSPAVCVHDKNCWSVTYTNRRICVLKNSTVDISCSYTHPSSYIEGGSFWFTQKDPLDLSSYSEYAGRVRYNRNTENHHTMIITDLTENDSAEYKFRLLTTDEGRFSGIPGVILTVTDLLLEMDNTSVSEGKRVTLRCRTKCPVGLNPTYIWYKNGQRLTNPISSYNSLILDPVCSEDAGNYSCVLEGFERILSPEETLTVRYGPKNTTVSVSPSGEIVEGSSVTLTCSSDSNPPVDKYTWYKNNGVYYPSTTYMTAGPHLVFNQIKSSVTGQYYCEVYNGIKTGRSEYINVNVKYAPKNTSVLVSPSGGIVEGSSVILTCSSDANPPVDKYTWYKKTITSPKASGQSYSIANISSEDSGEYYCEVENKYGHPNSSSVFVDVQYGPKNTSVSVSPSGEIVEGSSVTLTCSSDANPQVDKYTWYKKNVTSPKASGQSYSITYISSEDSGEYYCEARNKIASENSTAQMIIVAGKQTSVMTAAVGIIVVVLVLILCLSGLMWFRKKASKSTSDTRDPSDIADDGQGDSSPVYDNISGMAMTPTATQTAATVDQDDVHYASVHFSHSKNQEVSLYSTVQKQKQDEDVQYAVVKLNRPSSATKPAAALAAEDSSVLYSTVNYPEPRRPEHNKPRTKKT